MKFKTLVLPFLACLALGLSVAHARANEPTAPSAKKTAGPNGGRILTGLEPRAEFFVTTDRKVQITFLGQDGKPVAPAEQAVTVTAGDRAAPTKLAFAKSGNVLLSDVALPAGDGVPTVVQIKPAPDAKTVTHKFNVDLSTCPGCNNAEYACTCGH